MRNKTIKNTGIILICSIIAKLFSYIWEAFLAATIGISSQADALYMTLGIFEVLYPILDIGIWKVFLPVYKRKLTENDEDSANTIANKVITLFLILSVVLVCSMVLFAEPIILIIAPGYSSETKQLTAQYLRALSPMYLFMTTASVIGAVLQCHNKFFGSQLREISTHIAKILSMFLLYRIMGVNAAIMAYIIGSVFRVLLQIPFINWSWKFQLDFNFDDSDIRHLIRDLPSVATTAAITQINSLIDKIVASTSVSGSVSSLNYGRKLINVFSGLITNAIGTAIYPTIVEYRTQKRQQEIDSLLTRAILVSVFLVVPVNCYCIYFPSQIISIAFERGAFDSTATGMASGVFIGYSLGMLFSGITTIITNVFYAFGETRITLRISCLDIILNIVFDIVFVKNWGVMGLAVATSLSCMICFVIRISLIKRYVSLDRNKMVSDALKILVASIIGCHVAQRAILLIHCTNLLITLLLSVLILCTIYLAVCFLLKVDIIHDVKKVIKKNI